MRAFLCISVAALALTWATQATAEPDWSKVDAALERTGAVQAGGIHRYGLPRGDLHVTLDGLAIKPALALGGWVAFQPMNDNTAMIMGDLVLTETEISPVMAKLLESGVEVTAVHNHLLRASPAPLYVHIGGHGDAVKLAAAIHAALALSATPPQTPAATSAPAVDLDTAKLDEVMGAKGKGEWRRLPVQRAAPRCRDRECHDHSGEHGRGEWRQLSADRRWQGGSHRRLRGDR